MTKIALLISLLLLAACSFKKSDLKNQKIQGHEQLYSEPEALKESAPLPKHKKRVVIISTNDWLGQFQAQTQKFRDDHNKTELQLTIGGIGTFSSYLKTIRETYPSQTLLLDSGNFLPVGDFDGKIVRQAGEIFSDLKYDAVTLGLQDFNRTPMAGETPESALRSIIKGFKPPVLLSNMYDLKSGRVIEWQGTLPYLLKEVNGVKIGLIGLIPDDFVSLTPVQVRNGLYIEGMLQSTLRQSRLLRSLGAEMIIVMTHAGIVCGEEVAQELKLPLNKVNFETLKSDFCETTGLIADYIQRLPSGIVDVLITGRHLQKTANKINGVVVLSSFGKGQSFSLTEFIYDKQAKQIEWNESKIHQPLLLCHEFFKESSDCYYEDPSIDHSARSEALFWGKPVVKDVEIEKKFPLQSNKNDIEIEDLKEMGDIIYYSNFSGETPIKLEMSGQRLFDSLNHAAASQTLQFWNNVILKSQAFYINDEKLDLTKTYSVVTSLEKMSSHLYLKKMISSPDLRLISSNEIFADELQTIQAAPTP